jgi:hypothetical protein
VFVSCRRGITGHIAGRGPARHQPAPGWSTARLSKLDDLVRVEIETALGRGIRVIPVLVDDAEMPRTKDLPESLATLTHRHGTKIRHDTFRQDVTRLLDVLGKVLVEGQD